MGVSPCLYHPVRVYRAGDRERSLLIPGNLFLAPVAGYSDRAFRSVCRDGGADFAYTEMVSAEALVRGSGKTEQMMTRAPGETLYGVQIFGGDPAVMAEGARIVGERAAPELVDINAGCPVPKIVKTGAGSMLTKEPEKLYRVVRAVCGAVSVPVTVKIRSGWDSALPSWKEAALAAVEAGAGAVTLHPRTRAQGYEGPADWDILAALAELLKDRVPVFGSGDVWSPEAARDMLERTGCSGVMFARGAMGNPFVFAQTRSLLLTGSYEPVPAERRLRAGMRELELLSADRGETSACREMRKRFCSYSKGLPGGAGLRSGIVRAETIDDYDRLFRQFLVSGA